jgi:uncharacterized protein
VDVTPLIPAGRQIIESYGDGRFRVSGAVHESSILVFPDRTLSWAAQSAADISLESLDEVAKAAAAGNVDVLLIGCGTRMALIPGELRRTLRAAGIVIEPMDTGAACRTYNVLMAEGRRVAAALIPVA